MAKLQINKPLLALMIGVPVAAIAAATTMSSTITKTIAAAAPVVVVRGAVTAPVLPATKLGQTAAAMVVSPPAAATAELPLAGVNLSGGEFGTVPGKVGFQYIYPTKAEIDYFQSMGFKMIRIPFRWERLQPTLYGPLVAADRAALKTATDYATSKGMVVVLDMHDFARRRADPAATSSSMVGSAAVTASALSNAWTQLAADYRDNPKVWLGLMNEPNNLSAADWWRSAQQVVTDLRAQHITNKLMVPGVYWTGAYSWISAGNAALAEKLTDPANNYAFEVHQYLDKDSSGTKPACVAGAAKRVDAVIAWAEAKKVKLFFGEFGADGTDAQCKIEYPAMLGKLNASSATLGWTAWGGGNWWTATYMFRLAPVTAGVTTPHMLLLQQNMPK